MLHEVTILVALCLSTGSAKAPTDRPSICGEYLLLIEAVYKLCGTTGLWATRACAVVGPVSGQQAAGKSEVIRQAAEVKPGVKNKSLRCFCFSCCVVYL